MKQIKCEMCGDTDLVKKDGAFECQSCGMKYTVEEARKLLVEGSVEVKGVVEVTGTVAVDPTKELENLLQNARRARTANDITNAANIYKMIALKDASNWEATFYEAYCKAEVAKFRDITTAYDVLKNSLKVALDLICSNEANKQVQKKAYREIAKATVESLDGTWDFIVDYYKDLDAQEKADELQRTIHKQFSVIECAYALGDKLVECFGQDKEAQNLAVDAWKLGVEKHRAIVRKLADKEGNRKDIACYIEKIQKYELDYTPPKEGKPCYVATCVYGSYDCAPVWTLRRFRDEILSATWYGRAFVRLYYAVSPTVVKWFGKTQWFQIFWRKRLDKLVAKLNNQGVVDTFYLDK